MTTWSNELEFKNKMKNGKFNKQYYGTRPAKTMSQMMPRARARMPLLLSFIHARLFHWLSPDGWRCLQNYFEMFECLHPPPKIICLRPDFCRFWQGSYHNLVALELFDVLCFFLCGMWCGVVWHFGSGTLPQIFTQRLVQGAGGAPKK